MQSRGWAITWRKCLLLVAFVTTLGVCSLTAQTPQELELIRAGRQFRRQVYLQYRTDRPEFDRRRAAAVQAEEAYRAAGADESSAERLRTWLLAAAAASRSRAVMPPTPNFGPQTRVAETPELPSPMTGEPQGPQPPETPNADGERRSIVELEEPPVEPPHTPAPETPEATPIEEPATPIAQPSEPPTESPYQDEMPTADAPAVESTVEPAPFEDASTPAGEESTEASAPAADVEAELETELEDAPADEAPEAEPAHEMTPEPAAPEPAPDATFEPNRPSSSGVNVTELGARIAGHNFAVRGILLNWRRSGNDDLDELAQAVEQTEALGRRYGLLRTYTDLLTAAERTRVEELETLDGVFTTLGNAIADLRERVEASDAPANERDAAVERLNGLSQRLAAAYEVYEHDSERQP